MGEDGAGVVVSEVGEGITGEGKAVWRGSDGVSVGLGEARFGKAGVGDWVCGAQPARKARIMLIPTPIISLAVVKFFI